MKNVLFDGKTAAAACAFAVVSIRSFSMSKRSHRVTFAAERREEGRAKRPARPTGDADPRALLPSSRGVKKARRRIDLVDATGRAYYYSRAQNEGWDTTIQAWFNYRTPRGHLPLHEAQPLDSTMTLTTTGDALSAGVTVRVLGYGKIRPGQQYGQVALAGVPPGLVDLFARRHSVV